MRKSFYEKRKEFLTNKLEKEVSKLQNRARFVSLVASGQLKVGNRTKQDLLVELEVCVFFCRLCSPFLAIGVCQEIWRNRRRFRLFVEYFPLELDKRENESTHNRKEQERNRTQRIARCHRIGHLQNRTCRVA